MYIGEEQSLVKSGPENIPEAVETPTAVGGWAWLLSCLVPMILLLKQLIKFSVLRAAGMYNSTEL